MFLFHYLCLLSFVSLIGSSKVCDDAPEYSSCSMNKECACLQYSGSTTNAGICGLKTLSCSMLKACSSTGHGCSDHNHVCIRHPLCDFRSVCYPLNKANEETCPTFQTTTKSPSTHPSCYWNKDGTILLNQLNNPTGLFLNENENTGLEIFVADSGNDRIVRWTPEEQSLDNPVFVSLNGSGQMTFPRDILINETDGTMFICDHGNRRIVQVRNHSNVIETILTNVQCESLLMDNEGSLVASELNKDRVTKWEKVNEYFSYEKALAGASGKGSNLNQLNEPGDILFDQRDHSIYIADSANHRIVKWIEGKKEGIIVAGGQGQGNTLHQLNSPKGIALHSNGDLYIADTNNHRIIRWRPGAKSGTVLVQTNLHHSKEQPFSLVFDEHYHNLYVTDSGNSQLLRFFIDGLGNCVTIT